MVKLVRERLSYSLGNENDPGNPFGRSRLCILADGRARLDHYARGGGHFASTGTVRAEALDRLWGALEIAGFPDVPHHPVPGGSTIRSVAVGSPPSRRSAHVAFHAASGMPGYGTAFALLDTIVRQLSADAVRDVAPSASIVDGIAPASAEEPDFAELDERGAPPPAVREAKAQLAPGWIEERPNVFVMSVAPTPVESPLVATEETDFLDEAQLAPALSPGTAYLLAYLLACRTTLSARLELLDERGAAALEPALATALASERERLEDEKQKVELFDARIASLEAKARLILRAAPMMASGSARLAWMTPPNEIPEWLTAVGDAVRPRLDTPLLEAAWRAGEAARLVSVSVALAASVAHLRRFAPGDADLRTHASSFARALQESAATLRLHLEATGFPLLIDDAGDVAKTISLSRNLEPTTLSGASELAQLASELDGLLETKAVQLDAAVPPPPF